MYLLTTNLVQKFEKNQRAFQHASSGIFFIGLLVRRKTCSAVALSQVDSGDRSNFNKILEAIKTNFNDRGDELRKHWGGGLLGSKSAARIVKIERAKAKEMAQKQG